MGYLDIANNMVDNSMELLDNVLNSKFTTYLQGNGTPAFVTYYNIDETMTTLDSGTYTIDKVLGEDSPLRFNRIENFPVYGLRELIPSVEELEGNLFDLIIDTEVIILPNTIKPSAYDYFVYDYLDKYTIVFQIREFEFASIKNNNYYKLMISLKDINNTATEEKLEKQVTKGYHTRLDNIGTQDKCIVEDKIYMEIGKIEKAIDLLIDNYLNVFYDKRYNCLLLRDNSPLVEYPMYDPYLTKFVVDNSVLDSKKHFIVLVNFDYRHDVEKDYRTTIYKALENRNLSKLISNYLEPVTFKTVDTNPFGYYGEENIFTLELYPTEKYITEDEHIIYGDKYLLDSIFQFTPETTEYKEARPDKSVMKDTEESIVYNDNMDDIYDDIFEDIEDDLEEVLPELEVTSEEEPELGDLNPWYLNNIKQYLTIDSMYDLFKVEDVDKLLALDIEDTFTDFIHIPILIYILKKYISYLNNNK